MESRKLTRAGIGTYNLGTPRPLKLFLHSAAGVGNFATTVAPIVVALHSKTTTTGLHNNDVATSSGFSMVLVDITSTINLMKATPLYSYSDCYTWGVLIRWTIADGEV